MCGWEDGNQCRSLQAGPAPHGFVDASTSEGECAHQLNKLAGLVMVQSGRFPGGSVWGFFPSQHVMFSVLQAPDICGSSQSLVTFSANNCL